MRQFENCSNVLNSIKISPFSLSIFIKNKLINHLFIKNQNLINLNNKYSIIK